MNSCIRIGRALARGGLGGAAKRRAGVHGRRRCGPRGPAAASSGWSGSQAGTPVPVEQDTVGSNEQGDGEVRHHSSWHHGVSSRRLNSQVGQGVVTLVSVDAGHWHVPGGPLSSQVRSHQGDGAPGVQQRVGVDAFNAHRQPSAGMARAGV